MLGDQVSHDVIAAFIAGLALIIVATLPMLWRRVDSARAQDRANRVDMVALRERQDELVRMVSAAQERRATEHREILVELQKLEQLLLDSIKYGKEAS